MSVVRNLTGGILWLLAGSVCIDAQPNVITNRYDNARTASNLLESVLNVSNVNSSQFGLLYSYPVDGSIYAQPLYAAQVQFADLNVHNVLYVATMNDKLYAFDADSNGPALWSRDFTNPSAGVTAIPITDIVGSNDLNIVGNVGIEGTPAIDLAAKTMYFVARTEENGVFVQRLHAIDITTGQDRTGSPVVIQASIAGTAADAVNGVLTFNSKMQQQRVGLALVNGILVIGWGSHEDYEPYHGWIMAYNASTLQQVGVFCTTPNGDKGGVWQGGRAPAIDPSGNLYYETGNGDWDGITSFSDSVLKFSVGSTGFTLLDWFTPADESFYKLNDVDLGSSGLTLIPNTNMLVGGGKPAILYLLNGSNLGHQTSGDTGAIQRITVSGAIFNGPAYWNSPAGSLVYLWVGTDVLQSYLFNNTTQTLTPYASGAVASGGTPAAALAISANGSPSSGIIWGEHPLSQPAYHGLAAGVLRAFNAQTLQELWNTEMVPARDRLGTLAKFVAPVVANGRVYAATLDGVLKIYGILPSDFSLAATPATQSVPAGGGTANYTVTVTASSGFSGTVGLSASGLPTGATAMFTPPSVSGGAGTSALQITTTAATPTGTYTVTITGTSGMLVHTATIQLVVNAPPDFSVTATPATQSVAAGGTANYTATVSASNGFSGTVGLSVSVLPTGATATFTPATVSGGGGTSALQIVTAGTTAAGVYTVTITGTSGTLVHTASVQLAVSNGGTAATAIGIDFVGTGTAMAASETAGVVVKTHWNAATGATSSSPMALVDENGVSTGAAVSWQSDNGWATAIADTAGNFRMMRGYLDNGAGNQTVVTVANLPASATGYDVYVYTDGSNGSGTRTGNYQISGPGITTVSVGATDASNVDFSGTFTQANGTAGNYVKFTINAAGFTLTAIPGTASDFVMRAPVNGIQIVPLVAATPDFSVTATPATQSIAVAGTANYTATIAAVNGFSGAVALSATGLPTGATATYTPATVSGGAGTSSLQIATTASTPAGVYTVSVTGTSGTLVHSASVQLTVTSGTVASTAISIDFVGSGTTMGATETAGVVPKSNWNAATGGSSSSPLALVDENGISTGAAITWQSDNVWATAIADTAGNFRMMRGYLDNGAGNASVITVSNLPVSGTGYDVYVYTDGANGSGTRSGAYQISGAGITTSSVGATDAGNTDFSGSFVQANGSAGNYVKFTINATGFTLTAVPGTASDFVARAPVNGIQIVPSAAATPDFTVTATPGAQSVAVGGTASYTATVAAVNGFNSAVALSATGLPTGATATYTPATVSGGAGTSSLQIATTAGTPAGVYTVSVTGTSGTLVHSASVQLTVTAAADFTMTATPGTQTVAVGGTASYTATVAAVNGFSNAVALSATGLPTGATATFTPVTVTGGAGASSLQIATTAATPTGVYTVSVTGTSGTLVHSASVQVTVTSAPDFTLTATPGTQSVAAGGTASYTATVAAVNGFSGAVALSATGLPTGATATFTPVTVTGGAGASSLQIATTAATPTGVYTVSVTGTSGTLVHTATVQLTVSATSSARAISINFVGSGMVMGSTETAGVVPKTHWNSATGATRATALALSDENGTATGATVTWQSDNIWSSTITDSAGNFRMMRGYLDNGSANSTIVNVASLPASATGYDVYVYADGSNGSATRNASYRISGTSITTTTIGLSDTSNFNGTFIQATGGVGNYVKFTINATAFTLTAIPGSASDFTPRAPVNGIQIIPH